MLQLADTIEKAIPDQARPHGLFLHPVDWKLIVLALRQMPEPKHERGPQDGEGNK